MMRRVRGGKSWIRLVKNLFEDLTQDRFPLFIARLVIFAVGFVVAVIAAVMPAMSTVMVIIGVRVVITAGFARAGRWSVGIGGLVVC